MKKMLLLTVALVLVAGVAAAGTSIVNSNHDMRSWLTNESTSQVCVFCHTPHMAAGRTQDPLWNHSMTTTGSFGVYSSSTMNSSATAVQGTTSTSLLCLSCHDGTVAVNSFWKNPTDGGTFAAGTGQGPALNAGGYITGSANIGTDLTNDASQGGDTDIRVRTSVSGSILFFGGTMQCGSCHNVHNPQFVPFLRMNNSGSGLCLACHIK
jgi:predicted CXXCH cytochrome family protein